MLIQRIEHTNPLEKCLSGISCYQYYVFAIIFSCKILQIWHILNMIFLSPPMDYTCENTEGPKNQCPCNNPVWDRSVFTETMQTKFGLHCDGAWLISLTHSMAFGGQLIGCLTFGFLSDKYGRLVIYTMSCLVIGVAGSTMSVMPSIIPFIVMRLIEGFGIGGAIVTSYVLCIEFCSAEYKELVTAMFHIPINIGHLTIPGVSYVFRSMDDFQMAIAVPMFIYAAFYWSLRESPKWLLDNEHFDELTEGVKKICPNAFNFKEEIIEYISSKNEDGENKLTIWDIFRHKYLILNFICMAFNYFVCGMGYYGVSQYIGGMGGDVHLHVAVSGILVIPGTIICIFCLGYFKRRNFLIVTNFSSGIFIIIAGWLPTNIVWLKVLLACISNCFFFMSFIIIFLYGVELFPTSVRNAVLGVLSVVARFGQILVPFINSLTQSIAGTIFGVMAIVGGLLCIPLPDTNNIELPSTLNDVKMINENKLSWSSMESNVSKFIGNAARTSKRTR